MQFLVFNMYIDYDVVGFVRIYIKCILFIDGNTQSFSLLLCKSLDDRLWVSKTIVHLNGFNPSDDTII